MSHVEDDTQTPNLMMSAVADDDTGEPVGACGNTGDMVGTFGDIGDMVGRVGGVSGGLDGVLGDTVGGVAFECGLMPFMEEMEVTLITLSLQFSLLGSVDVNRYKA
eukprot:Hpha_TRINITY_DN6790_c0_g1::TRINITY_DN6790_c0_g1_i2::g.110882::m.110882